MSVSYRILPNRGLVYIRYAGMMTLAEAEAALRAYAQDPAFRPGQMQLVDLSAVDGWERDFPRLMALQAQKAEVFFNQIHPTLLVSLAPTPQTQKVANVINRSWDGIDGVRYLTAQTEAEALALLGLPDESVGALLARA